MPALLGFLHIAVAIFFAIHAVRHGRNNYWLFILLAFPGFTVRYLWPRRKA